MRGSNEHLIGPLPNEFNKFKDTGALMQITIYHMTLKSRFISNFFLLKRSDFVTRKCDVFMDDNA